MDNLETDRDLGWIFTNRYARLRSPSFARHRASFAYNLAATLHLHDNRTLRPDLLRGSRERGMCFMRLFPSFALTPDPQMVGAVEVEQAFPEALKGPVLRRVQFQTTSRIDALVDQIYDEFKADYYPGKPSRYTSVATDCAGWCATRRASEARSSQTAH